MNIAGKTLEMFMNEKEMREFRVFMADSNEPGGCNQQIDQQTFAKMQMTPQRPVALPKGIDCLLYTSDAADE